MNKFTRLIGVMDSFLDETTQPNDQETYDSVEKIFKFTNLLVKGEINIIDVAKKANNELEIIDYLSKSHKEKFLRYRDTLSSHDFEDLIEMLKNYRNDKIDEVMEDKPIEPTEPGEEMIDYEDKYTRLYAEFDNYKKRTAKEKSVIMAKAKYDVLNPFLDVIDELELAKSALEKGKDVFHNTGISLILNKIDKYLEDQNIVEIDTTIPFDSDIHECLTVINMGKDESGKIIEVTKKGYTIDGKIVRYPKVVVAK